MYRQGVPKVWRAVTMFTNRWVVLCCIHVWNELVWNLLSDCIVYQNRVPGINLEGRVRAPAWSTAFISCLYEHNVCVHQTKTHRYKFLPLLISQHSNISKLPFGLRTHRYFHQNFQLPHTKQLKAIQTTSYYFSFKWKIEMKLNFLKWFIYVIIKFFSCIKTFFLHIFFHSICIDPPFLTRL